MTNREAIFQVVNGFGCVATSTIQRALSWNQINMTLDEINYELNMLLAQDKVYRHNHPSWKEPCWLTPEIANGMKW